jgi:hypothetical protein
MAKTREERELLKRKIVMLSTQQRFLTIQKVSDLLGITYPCAMGLLYELTNEALMHMEWYGCARIFTPIPIKTEEIEVRKQ